MSHPKCPDCRELLVASTDLFGQRRWRHGDSACTVRILPGQHALIRRTCICCEQKFTTRSKSQRTRKTCSPECYDRVRMRNMEKAREAKPSKPKKPRTRVHRADYLRRLWQARWTEQERRWVA